MIKITPLIVSSLATMPIHPIVEGIKSSMQSSKAIRLYRKGSIELRSSVPFKQISIKGNNSDEYKSEFNSQAIDYDYLLAIAGQFDLSFNKLVGYLAHTNTEKQFFVITDDCQDVRKYLSDLSNVRTFSIYYPPDAIGLSIVKSRCDFVSQKLH